jgi:hypothetical protein
MQATFGFHSYNYRFMSDNRGVERSKSTHYYHFIDKRVAMSEVFRSVLTISCERNIKDSSS